MMIELPEEILMNLTPDNAKDLCRVCNDFDFDVNVMRGRVCVDGKSILGVEGMIGRVVSLIPVTQDPLEILTFYNAVKKIGAF